MNTKGLLATYCHTHLDRKWRPNTRISLDEYKAIIAHMKNHKVRGVTICYLTNLDKEPLSVGYSICTFKDNYSRTKGREIAFKRAFITFKSNKPIETSHNGYKLISHAYNEDEKAEIISEIRDK